MTTGTTEGLSISSTRQRVAELEIHCSPSVSYAMAWNEVAFVDQVRVRNLGTTRLSGVLDLELHDGQGVLSRPWSTEIDLAPGADRTLIKVGLRLAPELMAQVEDHRKGTVTGRLTSPNGVVLATASKSVPVLAAAHWKAHPLHLSLEMLAAHVMPHSPAVAPFLQQVRDRLRETTGSASTEGYQNGPERVDQIARAVFETMQRREIRYSNPPPSWAEVSGQKVRTPEEVFEGRVGTCLDTTVVMAAALEAVGVDTLLWVFQRHAYLGYWRAQDRRLAQSAVTEVEGLLHSVGLGQIGLVETTLTTRDPASADFSLSSEAAHRTLKSALENGEIDGVCDVWAARRAEISPLPAHVRAPDGTLHQIVYQPDAASRPSFAGDAPVRAQRRPETRGQTPARVQAWKNSLLDLSLRNRLLKGMGQYGLSLTLPARSLPVFEDLINAGRQIGLRPADHVDEIMKERQIRSGEDLPDVVLDSLLRNGEEVFCDASLDTYPGRLRYLSTKARTEVEESGANNLFLALGTLVWHHEGKDLRSPLILVPVRLISQPRARRFWLEIDEGAISTPNFCLLEKLRVTHDGLQIPGLAEPVIDESGIDLKATFHAVRQAMLDSGLKYQVEETAQVGLLQFAKFRLWQDLDTGWPTFVQNPLVRHLVESPELPFGDPVSALADADLDTLSEHCPYPADSSQLEAVAEASAGRTFVLEGPPGTGKSQTITNLLTTAIRQGLSVLFVAEKRAALDVVQSRLAEVGMDAFCLDLHDKAAKPDTVTARLRAAFEHRVDFDSDALTAAQDELHSHRARLAQYAADLHSKNAANQSYYSARLSELSRAGAAELPVPASLVNDAARCEQARAVLADIAQGDQNVHPAHRDAWGFVSAAGPDPFALAQASAQVDTALAAAARLPEGPLRLALESSRSVHDLVVAYRVLVLGIDWAIVEQINGDAWHQAAGEIRDALSQLHERLRHSQGVRPEVFRADLSTVQSELDEALATGWPKRRKKLTAVQEKLSPWLQAGPPSDGDALAALLRDLLGTQQRAEALLQQLHALPGVDVPRGWEPTTGDPATVTTQLDELAAAVDALAELGAAQIARALHERLTLGNVTDGEFEAFDTVMRAFWHLGQLIGDETQLEGWAAGSLVSRWRQTAEARGIGDTARLRAQRWIGFTAALTRLPELGLNEAYELLLTGRIEPVDVVPAFVVGLARATRRERALSGGLEFFDPARHERSLDLYTDSAARMRELARTAVPAGVLANRSRTAHRLDAELGSLGRQINLKRRRVRTLLSDHTQAVLHVTPCVLVSPDSLARFLPAREGMFDLVVFDEASQIPVADAIGAMGRGRAVVVVGDSKQMPPTRVAEASGVDDKSDPDVSGAEDQESILTECVVARVPVRRLTWHYRSQDESLIAFSNEQYYDRELSSFPGPTAVPGARRDGLGVRLVKVQGKYKRMGAGRLLRTNHEEAVAVVAELRRRFAAAPEGVTPSIGVVTFNLQQQQYITSLIQDAKDDRLARAVDDRSGSGLFVKNLENVQGDERDTILFSLAFSANDKGVVPLNFGPLTRTGGERRLNVAITRARREVVLFCSFEPGQLRTEETRSEGIKHLRAYLEMADRGPDAVLSRAERPDAHRQQIAQSLRARGLVVHTDVGLSRFRVDITLASESEPERPRVAVLLDGPEWRDRRTTGDRDELPRLVLRDLMGWPAVERVWMPEWLADPEGVVDRLEKVLAALPAEPEPLPAVVVTDEPIIETLDLDEMDEELPAEPAVDLLELLAELPEEPASRPVLDESPTVAAGTFVAWQPARRGGREVLDDLPARASMRKVRDVLAEGVAAEGPIHLDRLLRLTAAAFDLNRLSEARSNAILAALPSELLPDPHEPFAWPAGVNADEWTAHRTSARTERPLEHIHLREIANAMVATCGASPISADELFRTTIARFGGRRLTEGIRARLAESLASAVAKNMISRSGDGYLASSPT